MPNSRLAPLFTFIYALTDPRDGQIRYIGKADDPTRRYVAHTKAVRQRNPYKEAWIRKLAGLGLQPGLQILEQVLIAQWSDRERFWIAHYRTLGARLTNLCEGGQGGCPLGRKMTEEHKARIAEAHRGRKRPADIVARIADKIRGQKRSPEQRTQMSEARKGKPRPPEVIAKIKATKKANPWSPSPEHRQKVGDATRGQPRSEETKAKISASTKGVPKKKARIPE